MSTVCYRTRKIIFPRHYFPALVSGQKLSRRVAHLDRSVVMPFSSALHQKFNQGSTRIIDIYIGADQTSIVHTCITLRSKHIKKAAN